MHHVQKADFITLFNFFIMHHYLDCIVNHIDCVMSDVSNSCVLYYQHNQSCDLTPLTLKLTQMLCEKEQIENELLAAEAKVTHL